MKPTVIERMHVESVQHHLPLIRFVEILDQMECCGFPCSAAADKRNHGARLHLEGESSEDGRVRPGRVGEVHVLELHKAARGVRRGHAVGGRRAARHAVEDGKHLGGGAGALVEVGEDVEQIVDVLHQLALVEHDGDQTVAIHVAVEHQVDAPHQSSALHHGLHEEAGDAHEVHPVHEPLLQADAVVVLQLGPVAGDFVRLVPE
mmetsp:Transcript_49744/g.92682  ORF Transcript_49744/g.92682 Transcript_49744/m.92682 type:complete len:204 (-) Transcript_49744:281-892(-)